MKILQIFNKKKNKIGLLSKDRFCKAQGSIKMEKEGIILKLKKKRI